MSGHGGGFKQTVVNFVLKGILRVLCKVDRREYIEALSRNKPMIMVMNHINFLEILIMTVYAYPLLVTGVAKAESWKNPLFAFLFNTYRAIPIDRSGAFQQVFAQVRETIDNGFFVGVFPEGTRSGNGILRKGKAGIIQMALEVDTPIMPVVHFGGERVWENMKRLRRTPFCFRAGRPFRIKCDGRPDKQEREAILDEIMGQVARLLPPEMRGAYSAQAESSAQAEYECKYLEFL